jgi:uncharacterized membrane-anchored protein YitT (DUF2179 family)
VKIRDRFSKTTATLTKPNRVRAVAREIAFLFFGSLIAAFAVNVFYVPTRLTMGGVSGIVSIIYQLTGQGQFLSFGILFILFNIPLLIIGKIVINTRFVTRSIAGTLVYSIMIDATQKLFGEWYTLYIDRPLITGGADPLIYCLFGGVLYGIGLGMVFRGGYTTGGTDIIAMMIKRRNRQFSVGQFILIMDTVIVIASAIAYRETYGPGILMAMYSFIAMYLTSKSIDILLEGFDYCRTAYIISDHSEIIADRIMRDLGRGVTAFKGQGMYTGTDKSILMCVLSKKQVPQLKQIVSTIDADAFVIVTEAREVLGEGFNSTLEF